MLYEDKAAVHDLLHVIPCLFTPFSVISSAILSIKTLEKPKQIN